MSPKLFIVAFTLMLTSAAGVASAEEGAGRGQRPADEPQAANEERRAAVAAKRAEAMALRQEHQEQNGRVLEERAAKARALQAERAKVAHERAARVDHERAARALARGAVAQGLQSDRERVAAAWRMQHQQRVQLDQHNLRLASLQRIKELAEAKGDAEAVAKVDALLLRERELQGQIQQRLQRAGLRGDHQARPQRPELPQQRPVPVPREVAPGGTR